MLTQSTSEAAQKARYSSSEPSIRGIDLLHPSIFDFAFLDCYHRAKLLSEAAQRLPEGPKILLDVGGRGKPYAVLFERPNLRHFVLDLDVAASVDLVGDARAMPIADSSVDIVLCTQVLEHTPEPVRILSEIERVLRPGGKLILSVPGIYPIHGAPGDYWRYTYQGLEWLLRSYREVRVCSESGSIGSFFLTLNMYLFTWTGPVPALRKPLEWFVCPVSNLAGWIGRRIYRGDQFGSNYFVEATR